MAVPQHIEKGIPGQLDQLENVVIIVHQAMTEILGDTGGLKVHLKRTLWN